MLMFEVYSDEMNHKREQVEPKVVPMWLDVSDVFAVRADFDPDWAILTFKPGTGLRTLVVKGGAAVIAAQIGAERDRQRAR